MGFVSEGKGLGSTFFFELPVYSAAFAGKERQGKRTGTRDEMTLSAHSNNSLMKSVSFSPQSSRSSRIYVTDSPSTACDSDAVEEFRPPNFDTGLSQESDSFPFAHSIGSSNSKRDDILIELFPN